MTSREHYTFGDGDVAAERLALLAQVFAPSSRALLARIAPRAPESAIDLGCGPGYTTQLVASELASAQVIGLDQSPRLLEQATRERGSERVSFVKADVSNPPFPAPLAGFLFSRFLLTHLRDPSTVVRAWASTALPGATLVLEETAFMTGEHPAFPRYYALVERMQAHYGQRMYIGRELEALCASPDWFVESSEIAVAPLPAVNMARLHALNLRAWSSDAFAQANYAAEDLAEIGAQLEQISTGLLSVPSVSCGIGQLVLRRAA
ncbi:MAG: class I SAM-dependent methyltransferase [Polyangiaceae bacterium]